MDLIFTFAFCLMLRPMPNLGELGAQEYVGCQFVCQLTGYRRQPLLTQLADVAQALGGAKIVGFNRLAESQIALGIFMGTVDLGLLGKLLDAL